MAKLTANQESFIKMMVKSDEHARHGFELLVSHPGFEQFFDALQEAGLFDPVKNLGPVPADEPGYVRIPYWYALNYLEAIAKLSVERNEIELAEKVMNVVRSVSRDSEPDGSVRDNYHTYRKFAEFMGFIPMAVITIEDLKLVPLWLSSRFDRSGVGIALTEGILERFLTSNSYEDWLKVCLILRHLMTIRWIVKKVDNPDSKEPVTAFDGYWLKKLINKHAQIFGTKAGRESAQIFLERLREIYDKTSSDLSSYWKRPAIEDHDQNNSWREAENCFVEGLRDVLLAWIDKDSASAYSFVEDLLRDDSEIVRRIGIYLLGERWSVLGDIYPKILNSGFFSEGHLHELYGLLKKHFANFSPEGKAATLEAIQQIPPPIQSDEPLQLLKYVQRTWLSAIVGKGYGAADNWFQELNSDRTLGRLSEHPDFHSYMESWNGSGPSPYSVEEILSFAKDGTIVEKLNAFQQTDFWRGPSIRALVETLEETVNQDPVLFLQRLQRFLNAHRAYQYGIINAFKRLWEGPEDKQNRVDWETAWEQLVVFFEKLIVDSNFWTEPVDEHRDLTPTRDWIPSIIAEFLKAGTRDDKKAYSPLLLSKTWLLINILLKNLEAVTEARDDAMFQAINSARGKAIEALFSHALRVCRVSDAEKQEHASSWESMRLTFEVELEKCHNTNYEFSTLAGNYIAHLHYMNHAWLETNIKRIFPMEFVINFNCALEGLAYASASRQIYTILADNGIVDAALMSDFKGKYAHEKFIERLALAYLWTDEELDGKRFSYLFEKRRVEDIEVISHFFFTVNTPDLTIDQKMRILQFWNRCVEWVKTIQDPPINLFSTLSRLSCYIEEIADEQVELLLSVAPYVNINHYGDEFIEELDRLAEKNPSAISEVLKKVLEAYVPVFDYQDRLKNLLIKLSDNGRREDVLSYLEKVRSNLPLMANQLFKQLTKTG